MVLYCLTSNDETVFAGVDFETELIREVFWKAEVLEFDVQSRVNLDDARVQQVTAAHFHRILMQRLYTHKGNQTFRMPKSFISG